jgi:hypothetical protein
MSQTVARYLRGTCCPPHHTTAPSCAWLFYYLCCSAAAFSLLLPLQIRLGLRFEGVRETDAQADKEGEEWRTATKVKLGTDFEACTKVMLGNNRAQVGG